jgi:uncharacterized membrane protein YhaH (DUF805 family)
LSAVVQGPSSPGWPAYDATFVDAVKRGFRGYAAFDGRASRAEFWYWYLFVVGVQLALVVPSASLAAATASAEDGVPPVFVVGFVLAGLFYLAVILPTLAVACRRLHDAGFSGLFLLLGLAAGLVPLILCLLPTSPAAVRYGPPGAGPYGPPVGYPPQQGQVPPGYGPPQQPGYGVPTAPQAYGPAAPQAYDSPPAPEGYGRPPVQPPTEPGGAPGSHGSHPA